MANVRADLLDSTNDAEEAVIGAILIDSSDGSREAIDGVAQILQPEHFYNIQLAQIYKAMLTCPNRPHQLNTAYQMVKMGILFDGAVVELHHLVAIAPCPFDWADYAHIVRDLAERRTGKRTSGVQGARWSHSP